VTFLSLFTEIHHDPRASCGMCLFFGAVTSAFPSAAIPSSTDHYSDDPRPCGERFRSLESYDQSSAQLFGHAQARTRLAAARGATDRRFGCTRLDQSETLLSNSGAALPSSQCIPRRGLQSPSAKGTALRLVQISRTAAVPAENFARLDTHGSPVPSFHPAMIEVCLYPCCQQCKQVIVTGQGL
jgi:hypothetical protein